MNPTENPTNPTPKFLIILVVLALILGLGWYFLMQPADMAPVDSDAEAAEEPAAKNDEIVVTKIDVTEVGESKLPAGFPSDIPVEQANVSESYRVVYGERGVTQYTVSYTSLKGRDAVWDIYNEFMKSRGYEVDTSATSKSQGQITGHKEGDTLSAIISLRNGVSFVQLSLLERQ